MISVVKQIKDKELIEGAMYIVNEGVLSILYYIMKRMNENEIEKSLN